MPRRSNTQTFILAAQKVHGNKYDYSLVDYQRTHSKVQIICPVHGVFEQAPNSHLQGVGCRKCYEATVGERCRLTVDEMESKHPDMEKGQTAAGSKADYWYVCRIHGRYEQSFNNHDQGHGCPTCKVVKTIERQTLRIEDVEKRHPDLMPGQIWVSTKTKYKYICPIHGVYVQTYYVHEGGSGCDKCTESKGEKSVAAILNNLGLLYEREKRFDTCRNSNPLPFDFCIPSHRVLIEYQGRGHYQPIECWGGTKDLRRVQLHDQIKRDWAAANGYDLIEIPYTADVDEVLTTRLQTARILKAA